MMPESHPDVRIAIEHSIKILSRWTLALYLFVAVIFAGGFIQARIIATRAGDEVQRTTAALCTFVDDLQRRADATADYLDKHEEPEPIPGISRGTLRNSLNNQRETLQALSGLGC